MDKYKEHQGPPVTMEDSYKKFLEKHKKHKACIRNKKYYVRLINKNRKVKDYLDNLLKEEYVKEKISKLRFIKKP